MMIYSLAARVCLMVMDCRVSVTEAILWVTRRLPQNMRRYYMLRIWKELLAL